MEANTRDAAAVGVDGADAGAVGAVFYSGSRGTRNDANGSRRATN